jgi:hypothetical protein
MAMNAFKPKSLARLTVIAALVDAIGLIGRHSRCSR